MIKNWKQFNENKVNPDSYLDMRMQEIKELLDSNDESTAFIYEWENKDDHELYVNFSANGMAFRYEFDIDNMTVSKFVGNVTDFVEDVESLEQGISIIEKDINSLLGISENMKYVKKFNEAIVDFRSDDIDNLMQEIKESPNSSFKLEDLTKMGSKYNIEIVDYDTFLDDLPERDKSTAPPRHAPFFGLVNPVTGKPRIVLNMGSQVPKHFFSQVPIGDILKHEQIHVGQQSKRDIEKPMVEPKNRKEYFSDKDEVMAFAFSIAKEIVSSYPKADTPRKAFDKLQRNGTRLYDDIRREVDGTILKRYNKYIYLYLEDLLK